MNAMEENLNLYDFVSQHDVNFSTPTVNAFQYLIQDRKSSKSAVQYINKQLSNAATREIGYDILLKVLPNCSETILEENAKNWASTATSRHEDEQISSSRLLILGELFAKCKDNQEFYKVIVQNLLPKIIETCTWVHSKSPLASDALKCLYMTMKYFPTACIVYKNRIYPYVMQFLDMPAKFDVIRNAAKCFTIVHQIGGSGSGDCNHIRNFEENFAKLYNTLNMLYDYIFDFVQSDEFPATGHQIDHQNVVEFREIPMSLGSIDHYRIVDYRLKNLVMFLTEMLQESYNAKKSIKPEILEVIQRGLDINVFSDERDLNRIHFNLMIQNHQTNLMYLLKALVQSLKQSVIRNSTLKLLIQYLSRLSNSKFYLCNGFCKFTVYDTIKFWIEQCDEQINSATNTKLIQLILDDITPSKIKLNLQMNLENKSTKAKSQAIKDKIIGSNMKMKDNNTEHTIKAREQSCEGALLLLEVIFKRVRLNIEKSLCTQLFDTIIGTLLDLCVYVEEKPYESPKCQRLLFKVLIAVFHQNSFTLDINLAVNILSMGQTHHDEQIQSICIDGLFALEKICQPVHPSLCIETRARIDEKRNANKHIESTIKVLSNYLVELSDDNVEIPKETTVDNSMNAEDEDSIEILLAEFSTPNSAEKLFGDDKSGAKHEKVVAVTDSKEPVAKRIKLDVEEDKDLSENMVRELSTTKSTERELLTTKSIENQCREDKTDGKHEEVVILDDSSSEPVAKDDVVVEKEDNLSDEDDPFKYFVDEVIV